ncbi:MAG: F0F1 ATP synthase subunit delta [Luteimonas sp.]
MTQALTLARPYARAAFGLARDESATSAGSFAAWSQVLDFAACVAADPRVAGLLGNPRLSDHDAVELLASPQSGPSAKRYLALLADNRRLGLLPEIAGLYEQMRNEAERVVKATVTSATALPASELATIKAALAKRFGREIEIDTAIDEGLIGGAVIDAGDVVIDGSLKGKLARLQAALAQ